MPLISRRTPRTLAALAVGLAATAMALTALWQQSGPQTSQFMSVSEIRQHTHIHGLAVDRRDPGYLLIATHHGMFRAGSDGRAELVSPVMDFMGFSPHPDDSETLYASGHPATGGNFGFIASGDGGRTWTQISPGANGPVDFHQMTVSPADPDTVYGVYRGLQISRDGGRSWDIVGGTPDRLIALAASASDSERLYAATEAGLLVSENAGRSWRVVLEGRPVTALATGSDGSLFAAVVGRGLVLIDSETGNVAELGGDFGEDFFLHLTIDPSDPARLFAATRSGLVLASADQGRNWSYFGSHAERVAFR
jgi:photosystem II stability/assembly factor-like uncharacterized protein